MPCPGKFTAQQAISNCMARIPLIAARGAVREPQILSKGRVSQHAPAVARVAGDAGEKNLTTVPEVSRQIVQVARKWMDTESPCPGRQGPVAVWRKQLTADQMSLL